MNKTNNRVIINEEENKGQLVFKPIDNSINIERIKQIKINVDEDEGYAVNSIKFNQEDSKILLFQESLKNPINININIVQNDEVLRDYSSLRSKLNDNISNIESLSFNKRQAYLTEKENWSKISLNEIEEKEKFKL